MNNPMIHTPKLTPRIKIVLDLLNAARQATELDLHLDHNNISPRYYAIVECFGKDSYNTLCHTLTLLEVQEYLHGMLQGIRFASKSKGDTHE